MASSIGVSDSARQQRGTIKNRTATATVEENGLPVEENACRTFGALNHIMVGRESTNRRILNMRREVIPDSARNAGNIRASLPVLLIAGLVIG